MSYLAAVIEALRFRDASAEKLANIPESAWPKLLEDLDTSQLTLPLGERCSGALPAPIRARLDRNLRDNAVRYERLLGAHCEIHTLLRSRGIEYLVLKGISQPGDYV